MFNNIFYVIENIVLCNQYKNIKRGILHFFLVFGFQIKLAIFQMLSIHKWLVATILDRRI
jgi:hypothetical protein